MITIAGAGLSGLALGAELDRVSLEFRVFEAGSRAGGVVRTIHRDGLRFECGPQRVRVTPELTRFLPDPQRWHRTAPSESVSIAKGGRLHPLPRTLTEAATTRALSLSGRLRAAVEPLFAWLPEPEGMTAGAFLRRRVGDEVYRTFVGPLFGGIYGSDPDQMEAGRTLIPALEALGVRSLTGRLPLRPGPRKDEAGKDSSLLEQPIIVPAGGMEEIPLTLAGRLNGQLTLETPVEAIEPLGSGGFRIEAGGVRSEASEVVLTLRPEAVAALLHSFAPEAAAALRSLRMNPIMVAHLDTPELPDGLGFQVAFGEPFRIRGATFSGNLDPTGRGAAVYLGGMADPEAATAPDQELMEVAAREFEAITGVPGRPVNLHRTWMPAWDRSWRALDDLELPRGVHILTGYTGRPGIIGRVREAARLARFFQRGGSYEQIGSGPRTSPLSA